MPSNTPRNYGGKIEVGQVKYILIAEAPLYGEKRSYIYNPDFGRTPFLEFTHINFLSQKLGLKGIVSNKKICFKI